MLGALIGDMVGAPYEFDRGRKTKEFPLFIKYSQFTDDSVMSIAVAEALLSCGRDADDETIQKACIDRMQEWGRAYPDAGYGGRFIHWIFADDPKPYSSWGNGSAMRVAPVAWYARTLDECLSLAKTTAEITHDSEEGIRGAQAIAAAIFLNRNGHPKSDIRTYIEQTFGYNLHRTTDEIRPSYTFETSCEKTVPESIICFLESDTFEDAVIRAISLGGDTDTMANMAGNIAAASMDVPSGLTTFAYEKLPLELREILG